MNHLSVWYGRNIAIFACTSSIIITCLIHVTYSYEISAGLTNENFFLRVLDANLRIVPSNLAFAFIMPFCLRQEINACSSHFVGYPLVAGSIMTTLTESLIFFLSPSTWITGWHIEVTCSLILLHSSLFVVSSYLTLCNSTQREFSRYSVVCLSGTCRSQKPECTVYVSYDASVWLQP
jgi:hypothetical protein